MDKKTSELISLKNVKEHETNPFIVELKGKMYLQPKANSIIAKGQSIVDTSTGEIVDEQILIGRRKIVDKSQFAKLYASEIGILYELTKAGQNVFLYLSKIMDYDNRAYFNYRKEFKKLGYRSETASLKGLRELITRNIIAVDIREHHYWLNPTIICKGERFAKYTEYVVGKDGESMKAENMLKQQVKTKIEQLPEQITRKLDKANEGQLYVDYPSGGLVEEPPKVTKPRL